jgi:hypothetical protein
MRIAHRQWSKSESFTFALSKSSRRACIALSASALIACGGGNDNPAPAPDPVVDTPPVVDEPVIVPETDLPINVCVDDPVPSPHVLFPTDPEISYEYQNNSQSVSSGFEYDVTFACAQAIKNKNTTTVLYPMVAGVGIDLESGGTTQALSFEVNELISSTVDEIKLHGYRIQNLPLALIGLSGNTELNVDIIPNEPTTLYDNDMLVGQSAKTREEDAAAEPGTIYIRGLTNYGIAKMIQGFGVPLGVGAINTAVEVLNLEKNGLPIDITVNSIYAQNLIDSWGNSETLVNAVELEYRTTLGISLKVPVIGTVLFERSFDIVSNVHLVEGVGAITRDISVSAPGTDGIPVKSALQTIVTGDGDGDRWVDIVDEAPDNADLPVIEEVLAPAE